MATAGPPVFAAVDLGASGGRVIAGVVEGDRVELHTVHRFPNAAHEDDGHLRWDLTDLFANVLEGLAALAREFPNVVSIGIDTWGVDYGLLDAAGQLLAEPIAYRDDRTASVVDGVHDRIARDELFRITGLQFLPFNTIYQLAAEAHDELWANAAHVALLPDLLAYWLTGTLRTEATIASTTGLVDVETGTWSRELLVRLNFAPDRFAPIELAGTERGLVKPELCDRLGCPRTTVVTTVGSHDTASAVVGVPATTRQFAYIASGTWSLVGLELDAPIRTAAARAANFTNERGVDGRIRFLRNVAGLWLLQESLRAWDEAGESFDLETLLSEAAQLPDGPRIDVDDPGLVAPGNMPTRIAAAVIAGGGRAPGTPAELVRCIVDSLADAWVRTVREAAALAGVDVEVIHVVGGGSQNELLCRRTAELSGVPVVAGPVEATALGNILVQARACGALTGSLDDLRARMASAVRLREFAPVDAGTRR